MKNKHVLWEKTNDNIPFRVIVKTILDSNLNEEFSLSTLFMIKVPNKEIFIGKLESIMED